MQCPFKYVYQCRFYTCECMGIHLGELLRFFLTPPGLCVVMVITFGLVDSHYLTHLDSMAVCWRDIKKLIFYSTVLHNNQSMMLFC